MRADHVEGADVVTDYKVALDVYNGPLDLLLFLIRREEVDIHDIPIARVLGQFIESVDLIKTLDPEVVGDFLVLAATLMEIKSRMLLPSPPPLDDDDEIADPRLELVHQLLEYKKFKDAARLLDTAAEAQSHKHPRSPVTAPLPADEVELESLDIWNLFDAFNRMLEQTGKRNEVRHIAIDETPITLHADDILDSIDHAGGAQKFEEIFIGRDKPEMIGLFLALLELIRQHRVRVRQEKPFGAIWLQLIEKKSLVMRAEEDEDGNPIDPGEKQQPEPMATENSADAEQVTGSDEVDAENVGEAPPEAETDETEVAEPDDAVCIEAAREPVADDTLVNESEGVNDETE